MAVGTFSSIADLQSQKYCAHIESSAAQGAFGWFAMEIDSTTGSATYKFKVDFTDYSGSCDVTKGVNYHIHTDWASSDDSSVTQCGDSDTGGHYDPNYACGSASQYYTTTCASMGRVPASGYTYGCNKDTFQSGDFAVCEVGDLSGKFGYFSANSNKLMTSGFLQDPQAPYAVNYNNDAGASEKWLSIVFHCVDDSNARFMCAKFQDTSVSGAVAVCDNNGGYKDSEENNNYVVQNFADHRLAMVIVISVVLTIVFSLLCYAGSNFFFPEKAPAQNTTIVVHKNPDGSTTVQQPYAPEVQPRRQPSNPMHNI